MKTAEQKFGNDLLFLSVWIKWQKTNRNRNNWNRFKLNEYKQIIEIHFFGNGKNKKL